MKPGEFTRVTLQACVPDFPSGVAFYTKLFGRRPDFEPHTDFVEWEVFPGCWFQIGQGEPRPGYPTRFCVEDIEASTSWLAGELGVQCSALTRIPGMVAFCNFEDPWGNALGLYQRLFSESPRAAGGSYRDFERP